MSTRTIKADFLARVEGEGGIHIKIKGRRVTDVKLRIFEPPRFFEAFLKGRDFREAPDITSRICGICPVAYQMSAVHAMEQALNVRISPQVRALRRLLYCGEWIESHALHIYMLHAPDFLGYEDAIQMAKDHGEIVQRGLQLKKAGNQLMAVLGGREIHPINVRVGGFYKLPRKRDFRDVAERLKWGCDTALETVRWVSGFEFPDFEQDYHFVAMRHGDEYPMNEGRLVSNRGLDISAAEYEDFIVEEHVGHSTALHSVANDGGPYFVGPMARFNLNFDRLSAAARDAAREAGLNGECRNPFRSIVVRAVETLYACDEALRIIEEYGPADEPAPNIDLRAATGRAFTEAPRGTLYHRYEIDEHGAIRSSRIVPPTSQNQKIIEQDLWRFVPQHIDLPSEKLRWQCEQAVRNYDPCISCSTHFLKLDVERE